jgi:hypothetical protein
MLVEEPIVLKQEKCHNNTLHVINLRFGYFYTCNFIIHGANDLKKICDTIFHCTLMSLEDI